MLRKIYYIHNFRVKKNVCLNLSANMGNYMKQDCRTTDSVSERTY